MTPEITCKNCRFGVHFDDGFEYASVDCHYEPQDITHTPDWWCGKYEEKVKTDKERSRDIAEQVDKKLAQFKMVGEE